MLLLLLNHLLISKRSVTKMMDTSITSTSSARRFPARQTINSGNYSSFEVNYCDDTFPVDTESQKRSTQFKTTKYEFEEGNTALDQSDKVLTKSEISLPIEKKNLELQKSNDLLSFPGISKNFCDQISAIRKTNVRICDLKELAFEENIEISADSEKDLRSFLDSVEFTRRPYIALLDNGNFRAVWKNADREQIGLQFRGGGLVHYVFFALRSSGRFMAQATGRDTLQNARRQIEVQGLGRLMTA